MSGAAAPLSADLSSTDQNEGRQPGDLLVRAGAVVFLVGAIATMITFVPFFIGTEPFPATAYFVSMLMGAGFALGVAGLVRSVAAQRRQTLTAAGG